MKPLLAGAGRWRRIPLSVAAAAASMSVVWAFTAAAPAGAASTAPAPGVAPGALPAASGSGAELFYTASDGSVWTENVNTSGVASSPAPLGGRLVSAPSPIRAGSTEIVFGQGTDNQLWSTQDSGSGWSPWLPLGGALTSKPGAVDVDDATYSVFARGTDGAVWEIDHGGQAWGSWHSAGGQVLSGTGPAAAYTSYYSQTWVTVTGTNGAAYYINLSGNVPQTGWANLAGKTAAGPGLTAPGTAGDELAAFARGTNGAGFYNQIVGGSQGWHSIGGQLTSGPGAATDSTGASWVFALGTDNQFYETNDAGSFPDFGSWVKITG